jgi:hypothetical protein
VNKRQKIILCAAITVAVLMGLFPPWIMIYTTSREQLEKDIQIWKQKGLNVTHTFFDGDFPLTSEISSSREYRFIFNPPRLEDAFTADTIKEERWRYKLDSGLLLGQWLILVVISSILIYMLRRKSHKVT